MSSLIRPNLVRFASVAAKTTITPPRPLLAGKRSSVPPETPPHLGRRVAGAIGEKRLNRLCSSAMAVSFALIGELNDLETAGGVMPRVSI